MASSPSSPGSWFWLSVALGIPALLLLPRMRLQIEVLFRTEVPAA